jgi:hypothetical protein
MRKPPTALREFLQPYDPAVARLFLAARGAVLRAAPNATELIYDAYNAVSAVYSFTDRMKEAFCHVAAYPKYVNLGFNRGASLADPERLLAGTGANIRHVRIDEAGILRRAAVECLLRAAVEQGRALAPVASPAPRSVVKAVYAKKRRP